MPLSQQIIDLIRDEIGPDLDVTDTSPAGVLGIDLESIYTDPLRGNSSVLLTALIVWRRRLADMTGRAFDMAKEGNWLARSQQRKFYQLQVEKYERLVGQRPTGRNDPVLSRQQVEDLA